MRRILIVTSSSTKFLSFMFLQIYKEERTPVDAKDVVDMSKNGFKAGNRIALANLAFYGRIN